MPTKPPNSRSLLSMSGCIHLFFVLEREGCVEGDVEVTQKDDPSVFEMARGHKIN